jgi:hypothetical protein
MFGSEESGIAGVKLPDADYLAVGDLIVVDLHHNWVKKCAEPEAVFLQVDPLPIAQRQKSVRIPKCFDRTREPALQNGERWIVRIEKISKARILSNDGRVKIYFEISFVRKHEEATGIHSKEGKLIRTFFCGNVLSREEEIPYASWAQVKYRDKGYRGQDCIVWYDEFYNSAGELLHRRYCRSENVLEEMDFKIGGKRFDVETYLRGIPAISDAVEPILGI